MSSVTPESDRASLAVRRISFGMLVLLTVFLVGWQALAMLRTNGMNGLKLAIFGLFLILLVPMTLSFWTSVAGFVIELRSKPALYLAALPDARSGEFLPRCALVMPAYNEDPVRMFAGLRATYDSLEQTGLLSRFDFFLLSDSTEPDVWVREEVAFAELRASVSDPGRLHYRNRRQNAERKTGNIADFCATWGDRYRYMVVLDADSIMTGDCLVTLVRLMEGNPRVGILQAPPLPANRQSFFGRLFQFAVHAYSPLFIAGLNSWQGGAGNYWGHNAIIRIQPFVEHCRLPKLPGPEPLGGSILSHDFVEAAFMRRAGWKVYLAGDLSGSYEEMPPSLITYVARDRRWCQGNLQHTRLLFTPGLHFINRLHLGMGVMSYLSSPLWLLLILLSTIEGLKETLGKHPYFPSGQALFPIWHISVKHQELLLFSAVMVLLLMPKILSLVVHLCRRDDAVKFGGRTKLTLSVLLETLFSTLLAPILALIQTRFVSDILRGRKTLWNAQPRGETETSFGEALRRHWLGSFLGVVWCAVLGYAAPQMLWWFSPVLAGLVLSVPMSAWTSRASAGKWAKNRGLFLTPDEVLPPEILQRLDQELQRSNARPWAAERDGLTWVLQDPQVCEVHLSLLLPPAEPPDPLAQHHLQGLRLKLHHAGLESLTPQEKRELLLDPDSVYALRADAAPRNRVAGLAPEPPVSVERN